MEHRLQELFALYLERRCTPAEVEELVMLLEQADAAEAVDPAMRDLWERLKADRVEHAVDWDAMYGRVVSVEDDLTALNRRRLSSGRVRRMTAGVAATVLLLVVGFVVYRVAVHRALGDGGYAGGQGTSGKDTVALAVNRGAEQRGMAADKKRVVHLPDGSIVILNKGSRLNYPLVFDGPVREVSLTGEAYFDVRHNTTKPFMVYTGKLTMRVLGTTFNIRAYPKDRSIEVTVQHGKVQILKDRTDEGLLTDNQQIRYDKGGDSIVRQDVIVAPVIAWKPTEINFDDITMEEAARRLEDRLHVVVRFGNPALKACRVTATFYAEDDLDEILTVLCGVTRSTYTVHDNTIVLDGKGCN